MSMLSALNAVSAVLVMGYSSVDGMRPESR
jgi:hypothetical protein